MSMRADAQILQDRLRAELAADAVETLVVWENAEPQNLPENAAWMRFAVRAQALARAGFTASRSRHEGSGRVEVQVFVPRGTGTRVRDELADWVADVFRGWQSSDGQLRCGAPEFATPPVGEKDLWAMRRVSVPYRSQQWLTN